MGRKPVGGIFLSECPHCEGEWLMDVGFNKDGRYYEKHCPKCSRIYRRIRGYGHKWYEIDIMDL